MLKRRKSTTALITDPYRAQLVKMHEARAFSGGGAAHATALMALASKVGAKNVLDYGCGTGALKARLAGFDVAEYDPAIAGKDEPPGPADLVACIDVLEHVEPDCLPNVLLHLDALTLKAGYYVIAIRPAEKRLPDGRNAHLIIDNASWWLEQIRAINPSVSVRPAAPNEVIFWTRKNA